MPAPASRPVLMALGLAGLLAGGLAACTQHSVSMSASQGSTEAGTDAEATAALDSLYRTQPGAKTLANGAKAVLIFPKITQAGLGVGGLYGDGVMREGGKTVGTYNIAGGTFGFQIGAQSFSQAYFFENEASLKTFRDTHGLQVGAGATVAAADFGANGEVSSSTLQKPLVVVTWGQSGLMAGAMLQGAKITEVSR